MRSRNDHGPSSSLQEPVHKDVERSLWDLGHWTYPVGAIGSLQGITTIPVVAGDSFDFDAQLVFRLSTLREKMYLDCMIDLFAFYVPHRHIYGDDWISFMQGGVDEGVTLGTDTLAANVKLDCVGLRTNTAGTLPRWLTRGYIQIYNRYFIQPGDTPYAEDYFTTLVAGNDILKYGIPACYPKTLWSASMTSGLTTADYWLPLVDTNSKVDILELAAFKGRLQTEQARTYYGVRYQDLLKYTYGVKGINVDADKRPELVMRSTQWLSGHDVDGTDDATLGRYVGKAQALAQLKFPRKFFPEHGTLWIMGLLRFPAIAPTETHYLAKKSQPTYTEISGDPAVIGRTSPNTYNLNDIFADAGSVALGDHPYAQWYRMHPNYVHRDYSDDSTGFPFVNTEPASKAAATYIPQDMYDTVFASLQLKHWNCQGHIRCDALRYIPDPRKSIFAGAR